METHGREVTPPQPRRITTSSERDRESRVRQLHRQIDPVAAKGLELTEKERTHLLARVSELQVEIENAPAYQGVTL